MNPFESIHLLRQLQKITIVCVNILVYCNTRHKLNQAGLHDETLLKKRIQNLHKNLNILLYFTNEQSTFLNQC
jgi:hypothetical protein